MKKVIFITGGSAGIGRAAVKKFIKEGWKIGFMDSNIDEASKLLETIDDSDSILFTEGNVRHRDDIHKAVTATINKFGALNSVFANAGIHRINTILDITDEELDLMVQTNIYGVINTLREAIPHIITAGGGSIVINASDQWFVGKPASFAYGMTKGALGQITRSLAIDLGPKNIRVNAICPGTTHTPLVDNLFNKRSVESGISVEDLLKEEASLYARGSIGKPEEVAELAYFLASDAASFCTGGHYLVDGGLVAS